MHFVAQPGLMDVDPQQVRAAARRIAASGALGKSGLYHKLFDYIVERSLNGEPPREVDIALDVFQKDATFSSSEDSVVRVYVRTLRSKLEEYYKGPGKADELKLEIPKGAYRITRVPEEVLHPAPVAAPEIAPHARSDAAPATAVQDTSDQARARSRRNTAAWFAGLACLVLLISVGANLYFWSNRSVSALPEPKVRESFIWKELSTSSTPITIILGDLLHFRRMKSNGKPEIVWDPEINSHRELQLYIDRGSPEAAHIEPFTATMLPKGTALGFAKILPLVVRADRTPTVNVMDEVVLESLRDNDVIYMGPIVSLGPLSELYFARSKYRFHNSDYRLEDRETGEFFAPWSNDAATQVKDYGIFARFRGPAHNRIVIFTALGRDVGLLQIARSMTSPAGIRSVESKLMASLGRIPDSFEVLFYATGSGRTDFGAEVISVHSLETVHEDEKPAPTVGASATTQAGQ
jgi:hypothetical protein